MHIPELEEQKNIFGRWSAFFIDRFRIVYLIIAAILIWGIGAYIEMPRELEPEVVLPYGHVLTTYVGAGPEEMETLVTKEIEKKLDELEHVKKISSSSGYGYSSIFVEFEQGVDMDDMLQKMRDKVSTAQTELPEDAETPQISRLETNNAPIMIINVSGDYDFATLKSITEKIKEEIEKNKEISEVQIIGGLEREIKVIVDPQKLSVYNLSLDQIKNAIASSNVNFPGGNIVLDQKNYNIRTVGEFLDPMQLENVIITYMGNSPLFLKDIAEIEDGYAEIDSYSRMAYGIGSDQASVKKSVALSVKKKTEADVIKVSKKIHQLLDQGEGTLYPKDIQVEVSGDTAVYVEDELGTVVQNSKSGLLLVIIVLFLFIGFGEALIVSLVIPLSIFIAFGLMDIAGMTFNSITLFSLILAVGMLVDNGIVVMENIDRLRHMGLSAKMAAEVATNQIAPAVASSTLTTLAAFFPIMLTTGIMGAWIKPIPITVIFALSASFLVAVTITPALCSMVLKEHKGAAKIASHPKIEKLMKFASVFLVCGLSLYAFKDETGGVFGFGTLSIVFAALFTTAMAAKQFLRRKDGKSHPIIRRYGDTLYQIIGVKWKRRVVLGAVFTAFALSIALIPLGILKVEMFSPTDATRLYINIETPLGTNIDVTSQIAEEVEKRLLKYSEIKSFVSNIGITGADSLDTISIGSSSTPNKARIIIDLHEEKYRDRTSMEIAAELREVIKDIPGGKIQVQELESGPPSSKPVSIELRSESFDDLRMVASDFAEILKSVEGTRDVESSMQEGAPELQVRVNKERASLLGLDDMTVALGIRNATHGLKATTFRNNQDEIDVVIHTSKEELKTIKDLEKIYFHSRTGQSIPFNQVAEIVETQSMTAIAHDDLKRQASVSSDVEVGIIPGDVVKAFQEAIAQYPIPEGMTMGYAGEQQEMEESFTDMFKNMAIAAILVFLILAIQFNSLSQPFIILFSVPMALIGVMPGLVLTGNTFGFVSFVGVVALVGIAVNDAIVLVDYINYLRKSGYDLKDAVKETGITRFMPVMATTITTAGGILPITIKQPFFAPMGYALIFGLSMATILTLIVVPVLYTILEESKMNRAIKREKGLVKEA
nr:efflux RND transporter permease subunit [Anaerosolibacter carboniphilus]